MNEMIFFLSFSFFSMLLLFEICVFCNYFLLCDEVKIGNNEMIMKCFVVFQMWVGVLFVDIVSLCYLV